MDNFAIGRQALEDDVLAVAELDHHMLCLPIDVPSLQTKIIFEDNLQFGLQCLFEELVMDDQTKIASSKIQYNADKNAHGNWPLPQLNPKITLIVLNLHVLM